MFRHWQDFMKTRSSHVPNSIRHFILSLTTGLLVVAQAVPFPVVAQESETTQQWHVFRGTPDGRGFVDQDLPESLDVLWEYAVPKGAFESTAAINNGTVYIGDLDGKLFAFDLETGEVKWEFQADIGFVAAPAFYEGRIYIGNLDGYFFCINADDGKEIWKHESGAEIDSGANFYGDNVIYGSQDASLYCLNRENGEVVWTHTLDDQIRCSPTVVENRCFVAGCDGMLHIINLDDGTKLGGVQIDSPTGVTPAALGDLVCFGTEQAGFYAINWKKQTVEWHFDDARGSASTRSCPAATEGHIVFGARNGFVYSLKPADGSINWTFEARGPVDSSPIIARQRVYIGGDDGRMYVLNLADGIMVSEKELNGKIVGSPAIANGRLIVATSRGVVYCLGKKD